MRLFFPPQISRFLGLFAALAATAPLPAHASDIAVEVPVRSAYVEGAGAQAGRDAIELRDDTGRALIPVALQASGELKLAVNLTLPANATASFEVSAAGRVYYLSATGTGQPAVLPVATLTLDQPTCLLVGVRGFLKSGDTFGKISGLTLSGPAAQDAIVQVRKNALSVHFWYDPGMQDVQWFYNEVTAPAGPTATFYMACGFHRGYFGMQRNSDTERRVIFSVWDSGGEAIDRKKVDDENRVKLVARGSLSLTGDFGHEGTGGHSHLKYQWKDNETCRFLLGAKPDGDRTIFMGYFFHPEARRWTLISAWSAPKDGGYLRGLYSFIEDYWGSYGHVRRGASFGNAWVRSAQGEWKPVTQARLTNNNYPGRTDYGAALLDNRFMMYTGGYVPNPAPLRNLVAQPGTTPPEIDFASLEWPKYQPAGR